MPIVRRGGTSGETATTNPQQLSFVERIRAGRVVPVISNEALVSLAVGDYGQMIEGYAQEVVKYPLPDCQNIERVAKYHQLYDGLRDKALKSDYLNWVKNFIFFTAQEKKADEKTLAEAEAEIDNLTVSEFAKRLGFPTFDAGPADPLLVLAEIPARTYITTSPFTFLEDALRLGNKNPRTEVCRWRKELDSIDSVIDATYRPSPTEPLVYHLHGLDAYENSLVLTEDDHLEFLVNVCQGQGNDKADRVPAVVRQALVEDLILLGFSLSSWAFKAFYAGMVKTATRSDSQDERGVCALQVTPDEVENKYLQDYVRREARFDVFWGDLGQYAQNLRSQLGG